MLSQDERRAYWSGLVEAQRSSGESKSWWCRNHGVALSTLGYWNRRLVRESRGNPGSSVQNWLPVVRTATASRPVAAAPSTEHLDSSVLCLRVGKVSIDVPNGFSTDLLGAVLSLLEARC